MDEKKRYHELALRAMHTGRSQFTRFLDPAAERDVLSVANPLGVRVRFFGGYEDAERRIAAFYDGDVPEDWEYPMETLALKWNSKFCSAQHRDLLGAVMGLGLERDATGDICLSSDPGCAYLFCTTDVAGYITANLESAGRAHLNISPAVELSIAPPEGVTFRDTVQTLRLDSVLAAGYKLSRSEAQKLIAAGLVKLNHIIEERTDFRLSEGDLISARGYGRLKLTEIQGETRKGRIGIVLFRYGK